MSEARQRTSEEPRKQRRVNPFAIVGVLVLVLISITMGVLGPQVNRRGNLAVGIPLIELLTQVQEIFYREERSTQSSRDVASRMLRQSTIALILSEQLGPDEIPPDLTEVGFEPVRIDESVRVDGLDHTGIAMVYEQMEGSGEQSESGGIVLLFYLPFSGDVRGLYARDGLGVPTSIESGALYIRRIPVPNGPDLWSATWRNRSVLHVLVAPNEQLFDMLIETLELSEPLDGSGSRIASRFPTQLLSLCHAEVKYPERQR